jgi:hypothetical protein
MHKLIGAASRHTAGLAAGVILTGGLVGGVLLTPGPAFAGTPTVVGTMTTITGTMQTPTGNGTTLNVQVAVTAGSGTVWPAGTVEVSAGPGGCPITLAQQGSSATGVGNCSIASLGGGTYKVTATYEGSASFGSSSTQERVTIGSAPMFVADSPPLTALGGQVYSYTFHAEGFPAPGYALDQGAPGWLHINPGRGTVWGTVPNGVSSFSYSVTASNSLGSATAGPFTVWVKQARIDIDTHLSCTSKVFTGTRGNCTLWVTNNGNSRAPDVTALIALPSQLRADFCVPSWSCSISDNTAYENLGTLYPGQTKALTVVFTAKTGWSLWGWHRGHRFTVKVVGFAASHGDGWLVGQRVSLSIAYVTIIPRGWWAA